MKIVNTLYNEPPDEIEQIVKMTDTEYEQIRSDRALLEEAVKLIKENQRMIEATQDIYGEGDYDKEIYGNNKSFLTRAKERLGGK